MELQLKQPMLISFLNICICVNMIVIVCGTINSAGSKSHIISSKIEELGYNVV